MKKVYLFCSAGMSTSMLASNMQDVANQHNLPIKVAAFPHNKLEEIISEDQGDYGMMNGEKVLKSAIRLIKANK